MLRIGYINCGNGLQLLGAGAAAVDEEEGVVPGVEECQKGFDDELIFVVELDGAPA